jgi:hypothetical protein
MKEILSEWIQKDDFLKYLILFISIISSFLSFFLAHIFNYFKNFATYHFLNKKDQLEFNYNQINKSRQDVEELENLLKQINIEEEIEEIEENFSRFISFLQHLCISILSDLEHELVFKYKYARLIETLVASNYIEAIHDILEITYIKKDYQWLYDVHKLAIKKGFIKK